MEFPHLGQHCSESSCERLDFLPVKCDACSGIFCHDHMKYSAHNCPSAYKKDVQVPACPLCSQPVPVGRGQQPDQVVGAHMDNDCQSEPAQSRRKIFANRCTMKGCKQKEVIPVLCPECQSNFCLRHRHAQDHKCEGKQAATRRQAAAAAAGRQQKASTSGKGSSVMSSAANAASKLFTRSPRALPVASAIQGSMSEDEALARALQESLQDGPPPPPGAAAAATAVGGLSQEEEDRQLAMAIAASERDQQQRLQQGRTAAAAPAPPPHTERNCRIV